MMIALAAVRHPVGRRRTIGERIGRKPSTALISDASRDADPT
jgi:hypothetical protein